MNIIFPQYDVVNKLLDKYSQTQSIRTLKALNEQVKKIESEVEEKKTLNKTQFFVVRWFNQFRLWYVDTTTKSLLYSIKERIEHLEYNKRYRSKEVKAKVEPDFTKQVPIDKIYLSSDKDHAYLHLLDVKALFGTAEGGIALFGQTPFHCKPSLTIKKGSASLPSIPLNEIFLVAPLVGENFKIKKVYFQISGSFFPAGGSYLSSKISREKVKCLIKENEDFRGYPVFKIFSSQDQLLPFGMTTEKTKFVFGWSSQQKFCTDDPFIRNVGFIVVPKEAKIRFNITTRLKPDQLTQFMDHLKTGEFFYINQKISSDTKKFDFEPSIETIQFGDKTYRSPFSDFIPGRGFKIDFKNISMEQIEFKYSSEVPNFNRMAIKTSQNEVEIAKEAKSDETTTNNSSSITATATAITKELQL